MQSVAAAGNHSRTTYVTGFFTTLAGVVAISPDSLLVRLTAMNDWSIAAGRGLLCGTVMLIGCALVYRRRLPRELHGLGRWGLAIAALYACSNVAFYVALHRTSVANVLIVFATIPLLGALLSRWLFGERLPVATWAAIATAMAGLAFVVGGSIEAGRWLGDAFAMVASLALAASFTILHRHGDINMMPAAACGMLGSGILGAAVLGLTATEWPAMAPAQWGWLAVGGAFVLPLGLTLLTLGPRHIPSAESGLLMLLETVLGPLWVWLAIGEHPGNRTLAGGAIVIVTLITHGIWRVRATR